MELSEAVARFRQLSESPSRPWKAPAGAKWPVVDGPQVAYYATYALPGRQRGKLTTISEVTAQAAIAYTAFRAGRSAAKKKTSGSSAGGSHAQREHQKHVDKMRAIRAMHKKRAKSDCTARGGMMVFGRCLFGKKKKK